MEVILRYLLPSCQKVYTALQLLQYRWWLRNRKCINASTSLKSQCLCWRRQWSSSRGLKKGLVEHKCPFYFVLVSMHFTKSLKKQHWYSVTFQWEIGVLLLVFLLKILNKSHKFLVLPCALFLTWKKFKLQTIPKIKEFYTGCQGKNVCSFAKLFHDPYLFLISVFAPYATISCITFFRRTALFQHSLFCLTWTFLSLLAFSRDPDVNGLGNPTLLYLFSHIEFIKQQMARDNVQFVRFESIDLHGVSRSKNVPSRFFQVSFFVSNCTFMCFHAPILKLYFFVLQAATPA